MKMTPARRKAKGKPCQLRIPNVCNGDVRTTVLAHVGKHGSAKRNHDEDAVYACSSCHNAIDFRDNTFLSNDFDTQRELHDQRQAYIDDALEQMDPDDEWHMNYCRRIYEAFKR